MIFYMLVYGLICFIYAGTIFIREGNRGETLAKFLFILCLPGLGFVVLWIIGLMEYKGVGKDKQTILQDFVHQRGKKVVLGEIQYSADEMDLVPLEEAFIVNDHSIKRKLLLNTLKKDAAQYIEYLQMGLKDEDTETSHYAASAIVEIKRKLELSLQQFSVKYENNKDDKEAMLGYAEILKEYLQSGLLDGYTEKRIRNEYIILLKRLVGMEKDDPEPYSQLIEHLLIEKHYEEAKKLSFSFLSFFPQNEIPYTLFLKVYFILRQKDEFQDMLKKLKRSNIPISSDTLNMIRFWSEEMK